ncbi:unnamed protein product [Pipistrellus nathusii]|uniref:Uncharacterized protein n=1 Tax=Pipistrellus nathusii TaxID=59473 RepID=A0ABN9ZA69_PIPNA
MSLLTTVLGNKEKQNPPRLKKGTLQVQKFRREDPRGHLRLAVLLALQSSLTSQSSAPGNGVLVMSKAESHSSPVGAHLVLIPVLAPFSPASAPHDLFPVHIFVHM